MANFTKRIETKDFILEKEIRNFLIENRGHFEDAGTIVIGTLLASDIKNPRSLVTTGLLCSVEGRKIWKIIQEKAAPIWTQYQELQSDRAELAQMEKENREASYIQCVIEGRSPKIYFSPEKDTSTYSSYSSFDMNNDRYEFKVGFGKPF